MMLAFAGAEAIIAGTSYSFTSKQFEYWDVVGNTSNMDGMDVEWADGNTTVSFAINYQPDDFTLIFYNNDSKVIIEPQYSSRRSSGGSSVIYRDRNITTTVTEYTTQDITVPGICDPEIEEVSKIPIWGYILMAIAGLIIVITIVTIARSGVEDEGEDE